jgi:raffinose/stachyose/melibiose transport system permease protein
MKAVRPYLFVLPALVLYGSLILLPSLQNILYSVFRWESLQKRSFVGFANYIDLIRDAVFGLSLLHNLIWAALTIIFPLVVGLLLAVVLAKSRFRILLGSIYFLPATVPLVVSGIIWGWIYNPIFGLLNQFLTVIGLESLTRSWIGETSTALYALNILGAWTFFGFCTVIFMSALQGLDKSLYEAAKIDGASNLQCFFHITIPSVRSTIIFLTIYSVIGAMKFFDIVYITTKGGPGYATEILGTYIFKLAFIEQRLGYSAGVAVVLLMLVMTLAVLLLRRSERV